MHAARNGRRRRRGFTAMDLTLTLPIFMLVLSGLLEFALLFHARTQVVEASRAGARLGTLHNVSEDQIENIVRSLLPPRLQSDMDVETVLAAHSGETVSVIVRVPMLSAAPDLLWPIGLGLQGHELIAETRMVKE